MKRKIGFFIALALLALAAVSANTFALALDNTISWGVVPNSFEKTPQAPKGSAELLEKYNGFFVKNTEEKKVYFTFDLGYEAGYTAEVLDILAENNIKGIFFLCGNYLQNKDLIKRMIDEGHLIGNHTEKHKDLPVLSYDAIKKDIVTLQDNCQSLYNQTMQFFRPPKGRFNEQVLKIANEQNLKTMLWSIAIVDWGKTPINAAACAEKIEKRLHPGAVILFHITNSGTPKMLKMLIPKIIDKGYQIGNPGEL